jgi:hypothetical protein
VFATNLPPATTPEFRSSTLGYALVGVGVALGAGATGVLLWNREQSEDSDANLAYLRKAMSDDFDRASEQNRLADSIRFGNQLTVGLALAAIVSLAGGAYLWYRYRTAAPPHADR